MPNRSRSLACALAIALPSVVLAVLLVPPAAAATEYPLSSVTVNRGSVSGTGNMAQDDSVTDTLTEGGTSALRWLKPTADVDADTWLQSGCAASHFACIDDDPVHDANTTYLTTTNVAQLIERFELENWPGPYTLTIDTATVFGWARTNTTPADLDWDLSISTPGGSCTLLTPSLTLAYANYSLAYTQACGVGEGVFTSAILNGTRLWEICGSTPNTGCTVTASGLVVNYRDTFYVDFSAEFPGIPSDATGLRLAYECTTTDETTTLTATHLGASVGSVTCDGTGRELALNGDSGVVTVSFASPGQTDGTASTIAFDLLVVAAETSGGGGGGPGDEDFFLLDCHPGFTDVACTLALRQPSPPGLYLRETRWLVQGHIVTVEGDALEHEAHVPQWTFPKGNLTVRVAVVLSSGISTEIEHVFPVDLTWVIAIVLLLVVAVPLLLLVRRIRRRRRRSTERDRKEARKKFWKEALFP
jgi:hypothetical protein